MLELGRACSSSSPRSTKSVASQFSRTITIKWLNCLAEIYIVDITKADSPLVVLDAHRVKTEKIGSKL